MNEKKKKIKRKNFLSKNNRPGGRGGARSLEKISETKKVVNRPARVYRLVNWSRDHLNVDWRVRVHTLQQLPDAVYRVRRVRGGARRDDDETSVRRCVSRIGRGRRESDRLPILPMAR